ncbi:membrane protein [Saccharopolyspora subtropica]|uniref:Membrane protein n=1 Tax=Saccharopolyspora thermophila TaxID=89367 RepID=A0A917K2M9_9PSEU|nr:PH domain-containing protein [Saccharopolyspora subtropica]GGI95345.1 membrane protein [Saccharopolyspora subtropica]
MSTEPVVVRPRKVRRVAIPVAVALVVVFGLVGTLLRDTPTGVVFRVSDQVAMALLGVLLACGVMLLTRPRLRADADGVEVRNIIGTQRFSWPLVQAFSFPDGAPWARLELPEDEYVPIMAIQAADGEQAVVAMRRLRELRRHVQQTQSAE